MYFKADDGRFQIFLPEHIAAAISQDRVRATESDAVIDAFKTACERYRTLLKAEQRKKVIVLTLRYNEPGERTFQSFSSPTSFGTGVQGPAVNLDYEVFWDINGALYRGGDDPNSLQRHGVAGGRRVIAWTQEREDFFAGMKAALQGLIKRLIDFDAALAGDVDAALADFSKGRNLLSKPSGETS